MVQVAIARRQTLHICAGKGKKIICDILDK